MQYVWYGAYGSNLSTERLAKYLGGGLATGSTRPERGARDSTAPTDTDTLLTGHQLYFALESSKWNGGGVAFVSSENGESASPGSPTTKGARFRLHRVTVQQFEDIYAQENRLAEPVPLEVDKLPSAGPFDLTSNLYGRLLVLGDHANLEPIITFTTGSSLSFNRPDPAYLRAIAVGLREGFALSNSEIAEYLLASPGMEGWDAESWSEVFD